VNVPPRSIQKSPRPDITPDMANSLLVSRLVVVGFDAGGNGKRAYITSRCNTESFNVTKRSRRPGISIPNACYGGRQ
jgi:hypothetical protein